MVLTGEPNRARDPLPGDELDSRSHLALYGRATRQSAVVVVILFGAALRLWGLGQPPLNFGEAFTAMAGRLPLGSMLRYLRGHDSHPPLDYILRAPISRAGASAFALRLPSTVLSIAAVGLFAWWMRDRGRAGFIATALMAVSTFQLSHGREARMYAELELLGVVVVVLADSWMRRPRAYHARAMGAVVFIGLLTHVQVVLLLVGLLALPGLRTDREAWRWRGWLVGAGALWAALWGSSFLIQSRGGHSAWIPRTSLANLITALGSLVTDAAALHLVAIAATVCGAIVLMRRDGPLARLWACCFVIPVVLAAVFGLFAPVLLDRTFTVASWAPLLAIGYAADALLVRSRAIGVTVLAMGTVVLCTAAVASVAVPIHPDGQTRYLEAVTRPGDVVALAADRVELSWSIGVRSDDGPARTVRLAALPYVPAFALGAGPRTGRVWLLFNKQYPVRALTTSSCARPWIGRTYVVVCLAHSGREGRG